MPANLAALVRQPALGLTRLARDMWGGLPAEPVRLLLVAGAPARRDELMEVCSCAAAAAGERVFVAPVADRAAVVYAAGGVVRDRVLAAAASHGTAGESGEVRLADLARANREADQALRAGLRTGRRHTSFADLGASGLLELLATPQAVAFAESLLRPLTGHDAHGRGELVRSLGTWLEHNGQWDAAAAAPHDLVHFVRAHALRGHPVQRFGLGPVPTQPQLQEPVAAAGAGLDEPPHRQPVADQRPELELAGVGVRVEVDDRDPPPAQRPGDPGHVRPGDRVVAAEDHRDGARLGDILYGRLQAVERLPALDADHLDVPRVDDGQVAQRVDAERKVWPGSVVRQVVGHPDGLRPEPGTGPVGGARVVRRADHDDISGAHALRVGQVTSTDAEKRHVRPVHASHGHSLPSRAGAGIKGDPLAMFHVVHVPSGTRRSSTP
jgi:hypothetical protein